MCPCVLMSVSSLEPKTKITDIQNVYQTDNNISIRITLVVCCQNAPAESIESVKQGLQDNIQPDTRSSHLGDPSQACYIYRFPSD